MIVILSSLNGGNRLRDMLAAMTQVRLPAGTTIHAVDNGSDDGTLELLNGYRERLPLVVYSQPVRGKNHCLNLVLDKVSKSLAPDELVVLTDDDVLPGPGWLEAFQTAADAHPDKDVFAGKILPSWPKGEPAHLEPVREHFGILFSLTSAVEGPINCGLAWGPNMVVRARVLQAGFRFNAQFGPDGTSTYPMGSETELMERLETAGYRAWFVEKAYVLHIIRASQLEEASVLQRAYRHGFGAGWRMQRGGGLLRLLHCQRVALHMITASWSRMPFSPKPKRLSYSFNVKWAQGISRGSILEFRASGRRRQSEQEDRIPGEEVSTELSR